MKIDTDDYVTMAEARELLGASPRGFYRALRRVGLEKATIELWGVRLVLRKMLEEIRENYYPFGSEQRSEAAKAWGASGGHTKAANAAKRSS